MAGELDDICAQVDCPKCGDVLNVSFRQMRLQKAAACSCGAMICLEDDTPIAAVQRLIDDAKQPTSANDA